VDLQINMPQIIFIEFNGNEHHVKAEIGQSVMQAASSNSVPGIIGECGGNCVCATCHVYVDEAWHSQAGEASEHELEMIEFAVDARTDSRLSCQIEMTEELDGLVVRVPKTQI
jgi:2Fe-2S ferredoxin